MLVMLYYIFWGLITLSLCGIGADYILPYILKRHDEKKNKEARQ